MNTPNILVTLETSQASILSLNDVAFLNILDMLVIFCVSQIPISSLKLV